MDKSEEDTIDKKLDYLTRVMCETAEQIVAKRLIRLDGFKWKASPKKGVFIFLAIRFVPEQLICCTACSLFCLHSCHFAR
jgi:hypothetical protein